MEEPEPGGQHKLGYYVVALVIWVAAFSTALMDGPTFKGRIGTITDITDAKKHFPEGDGPAG